MTNYFLRNNIKAEPLIWGWYAWPHLIQPLTAGCNIVERHIKLMESYIANPLIHANAVKDPNLIGGPFLNLKGEKIDEIRALVKETKESCKDLIALSTTFKNLNSLLINKATGDTLEKYYEEIGENLKGLVELVYDINHRPSIRIIEVFLYKKYYSSKHQKIALGKMDKDYRPFLLSTPRLENDKEIFLNIPFSDARLDMLFQAKEQPINLGEVKEAFELNNKDTATLFESFFTNTKPKIPEDRNYNEDRVRIRYFGHACVLVQTKNVNILFDPVISYDIESKTPRYTFLDLPDKIDYVVITHNHQDHIIFETLLQLRHKISNIVFPANSIGAIEDPSIKLILKNTGFKSLIELKEMESIQIPDGEITGLPFFGEHSDLNIQSKLAYSVKLKDKHFLFAADSNNLDSSIYSHIFSMIGNVDMLFLGMECDGAPLSWLYGPLLSTPLKRSYDKNRSLSGSNFEKAWDIVKKSQCNSVYIYAMGQEKWLGYIMALEYSKNSPQIIESNKLIKACMDNNITAERLYIKKEWSI